MRIVIHRSTFVSMLVAVGGAGMSVGFALPRS